MRLTQPLAFISLCIVLTVSVASRCLCVNCRKLPHSIHPLPTVRSVPSWASSYRDHRMKRKLLSVKDLVEELGISADSVCRAYRTGEIPGAQIVRIIWFGLGQVLRAMESKTKAMPHNQCTKGRSEFVHAT